MLCRVVFFLALVVAINASCAEFGVNYGAHDIDSEDNVSSWQLCGEACFASRSCSYWTWRIDTHKCYMKSSDDGRFNEAMYISGQYDCTTECFK